MAVNINKRFPLDQLGSSCRKMMSQMTVPPINDMIHAENIMLELVDLLEDPLFGTCVEPGVNLYGGLVDIYFAKQTGIDDRYSFHQACYRLSKYLKRTPWPTSSRLTQNILSLFEFTFREDLKLLNDGD